MIIYSTGGDGDEPLHRRVGMRMNLWPYATL